MLTNISLDPSVGPVNNNKPGIYYKMSNFRKFSMEKQDAINDRTHFEWLYDNYAPRAYGFITQFTDTKEHAEEVMTTVFLKVWAEIKSFDENADRKIQTILLLVCKPILKNKQL